MITPRCWLTGTRPTRGGSSLTARCCPRPRSPRPSRTASGTSAGPGTACGWSTSMGRADLVGAAGLRPLEALGLEIFYSLAPRSWGKGYATEAARAVLDHALGPLGLPKVLAEVDEGNTASIAVIERLRMTEFEGVAGPVLPLARYHKN